MIGRTLKCLSAAALVGLASFSVSGPLAAEQFAKGSKAKKWGLVGEEKALFSGKVVDVLCELAGDCPADCGNGDRNLAIVRAKDNKLVPVLKNRQPAFNGATDDLLPYCNKDVDVDGVLIGEDEGIKAKVFMIQFIRVKGEEKWAKTNLWTKKWAKRHPEAKGKGPWFRRDPRVKKQIADTGFFGLGHDVDKKWREQQ